MLFDYAATLGVIDVAHVPPADARDDFRGLHGYVRGTKDLDIVPETGTDITSR